VENELEQHQQLFCGHDTR